MKIRGKGISEEPLELKTGKSKVSVEHYGQVMLYCLALAARRFELVAILTLS